MWNQLELDMCERTTMDYRGPAISPQVQVVMQSEILFV